MWVKRNFPLILLIFFIMSTAVSVIIRKLGLIYTPYNIWVEKAVDIATTAFFTVLSIKYRIIQSKVSDVCCIWLPLISLGLCFTGMNFDTCFIFPITGLLCSVALFFVCGKGVVGRVALGILTALMLLFACGIINVAYVMKDFGSNTVVNRIDSPDGAYTAIITDSDQGALGGATWVDISHNKTFYLPLGTIKRADTRVYSGRYGEYENMTVCWLDDKILLVDGREYNVDALLKPGGGFQ